MAYGEVKTVEHPSDKRFNYARLAAPNIIYESIHSKRSGYICF